MAGKPFELVTRVICPMIFSFQSHGFRTKAEVEVMPLPQCSAHWLLPGACNKPGWAGPLGEIHLRRMVWVHVQSLTGHISTIFWLLEYELYSLNNWHFSF